MDSVPVNPYIESYLADLRTRCEPSTIDTYQDILYRADKLTTKAGSPAGLASACAEELRDVIHVEGRSKSRRHAYRVAIGGFFSHACDENVWGDLALNYDPCRQLAAVQVPRRKSRTIPTSVLADILARAANPFRVWYVLAAGAGLRCIEISRLDREHISADDMWVQGKGSKERVVPTHAAVWAAVRDLPAGPIARGVDGQGRATPRQVMDRGNYHLKHTLGHTDVIMHRLRHWFATNASASAASAGLADPTLVTQGLMGHASPETTQVYVDIAGEAKSAAVNTLPLPV